MKKRLLNLLLIISVLFSVQTARAQYITISGTVYDITARRPIEAVAVVSQSGKGTLSDSTGHYMLVVKKTDSIWFTLLNKSTMKYAVDTIKHPENFDISLYIRGTDLPEVKVRNSNYHLDSLINRKDYAKYFDYKKPGIRLSSNPNFNPGGVTVGLDLDELINMFRFRRNRNLQYLQNRLIQQEQDGYVSHRFNKNFVRKITKLQSPELDTFMLKYRPSYEYVMVVNDLELGYYTEKCYDIYVDQKKKEALNKKYEWQPAKRD